jgi:tetratricopeptide (TPR) repeat protein
MKKAIILFTLIFIDFYLIAQTKESADNLISEGIKYHDNGMYSDAISKYNEALLVEKDNLIALTEIALSYLAMGNFEESISYCKKVIKKNPNGNNISSIYVTLGNAYDGIKESEKAIKAYNKGIEEYPRSFQLHFNKGITQMNQSGKSNNAIESFQTALQLNPNHPGSHNALARSLYFYQNQKIPAVLAFSRFFVLEYSSTRAEQNLGTLQKIINGNVEKKAENKVTINLDLNMLNLNEKKVENNFSTIEMLLAFSSALDFDSTNINKSDEQKFTSKFNTICSSLSEQKEKNSGFFWSFYAPYFIDMKNNKQIETFTHLVFFKAKDETSKTWVKNNKDKITEFYKWNDAYNWDLK